LYSSQRQIALVVVMSSACNSGPQNALEEVTRLPIRGGPDVVTARQKGRQLASQIGFAGSEVTVIASAISEIARNIVDYAEHGQMTFQKIERGSRQGIMIVAQDEGPGIPNVAEALQYGCATRRGIGVGLPGAKWLMDEFEITSKPGKGTKVTMRKWLV
jgi:serine/threonine-protein kinase RsbT